MGVPSNTHSVEHTFTGSIECSKAFPFETIRLVSEHATPVPVPGRHRPNTAEIDFQLPLARGLWTKAAAFVARRRRNCVRVGFSRCSESPHLKHSYCLGLIEGLQASESKYGIH